MLHGGTTLSWLHINDSCCVDSHQSIINNTLKSFQLAVINSLIIYIK